MSEIIIGGDDAKRIMKGDVLALYEEKLGLVPREDLTKNLHVQIGKATEAMNLAWYQRVTDRQVRTFEAVFPATIDAEPAGIIRDPPQLQLRSKRFLWQTGTPDGWTTDGGQFGGIDAKHSAEISEWNPVEAIIQRSYWQMIHYIAVTGWEWFDLSVIYGTSRWEAHRVYRDEAHIADLIGRELVFLDACEKRKPPYALVELQAERIAYRPAIGEPEIKDTSIDKVLAECAPAIIAGHAGKKAYEQAVTAIKAATIPEGSPRLIVAHGVRLKISASGAKSIEPDDEGTAGGGAETVQQEKAA